MQREVGDHPVAAAFGAEALLVVVLVAQREAMNEPMDGRRDEIDVPGSRKVSSPR